MEVTNKMLYDLIQELKEDQKELKHDLYRRLDRFEDDLHRLEDGQRHLEDSQREDKKMLMDIWKSREKVVAQVTWDFLWKATAFNAVLLIMMLVVLKV